MASCKKIQQPTLPYSSRNITNHKNNVLEPAQKAIETTYK